MYRTHVTLVALVLVLLTVGALSATFGNQAVGQSAPALDKALPVGTRIPAEDMESSVQLFSSSIPGTDCEKNSGNPHIATSFIPDAAKTVGGVIRCKTKKDRLWAQARLWKKEGDYYVLKATGTNGNCYNCYRTMPSAYRRCWNRNSNKFAADAAVTVQNNGSTHRDHASSQVVTLNCGGF